MKILIFGDSITEGFYDNEKGGWVDRLKNSMIKEKDDVSIYNLGISGDTTEDLLERFDTESKKREPDIIIFAIGINDSSYRESKKENKVPLERFKKNIKELKQRAESFTNKIFFIGITNITEELTTPVPWNLDASYLNKNIGEYNKALKDFCNENNILFLELYNLLNKNDLEDGLHPNPQGHEKIFKKVRDFLEKNKLM
jgi:lysophospholipase L1-like esterase